MSEFSYRDAHNAVFSSDLGIYTKMVLLQIIDHLPNPRPGINRIAARCSMSRDQAMDEIKFLEALGVLTVSRRFGQGNEYRLTDGWMSILPVDTNHRRTGTTSGRQPLPPVDGNHGGGGSQPLPPVDPSHSNPEVKTETKTEEEKRFAPVAPTPTPAPANGFSLKAPEAKTEKATKQEANPGHRQVKAHYLAEFERIRRAAPTWGPAQAVATNSLLKKLKGDVTECCRRITNGLQGWSSHTILSIASDPDKCVNAPNSGPGFARNTAAPQRGRPEAIKDGKPKWMNAANDPPPAREATR